MAGVVREVKVKPGDMITDGMEVAVLESMKMELPITATLSGKVSKVNVGSGDYVEEGQALIDLE